MHVPDYLHLICAYFEYVWDAFKNPLPSSKVGTCTVRSESKKRSKFGSPLNDDDSFNILPPL